MYKQRLNNSNNSTAQILRFVAWILSPVFWISALCALGFSGSALGRGGLMLPAHIHLHSAIMYRSGGVQEGKGPQESLSGSRTRLSQPGEPVV